MPDYREMYCTLFNAVTDALQALQRGDGENCRATLVRAQQRTEEQYMEGE